MYNLRVLVLTAIIAALAHCSVAEETAGIKCYVCEEALNKDCGAGFKPPKEDDDSGNSTSVVEPGAIAIQEDCKFCVVNRITTNDVSVITRGCSSADVNLGCVSALVITTCTTSCNTNLCNVGDDAPSLRFALTTIISTLLLSLLAKM